MADVVLYLRPWRPGDETAFTPSADSVREREIQGHDWSVGPPGPTVTIEAAIGEVVGVAGFVVHRGPIQVESLVAWASLADLSRRYWPRLLHLADVIIAEATETWRPRLIWATARGDFPGAIRCLGRLGFTDDFDVMIEPPGPGYRYFRKVVI